MNHSMRRGAFIVFEGVDRTGKTTQTRLLLDTLINKGFKAKLIHFPERSSAIGQVINSYLTNSQDLPDEVIHLMFSANRWEHMKSIREELLSGTTLICDRYAYSGAAYTVAKGLDFNWCCAPDRGLIKPDAVFYLKAKPDKLILRGNYGEERYEKLEFQNKVAEVFDKFCKQEMSYWHEFDASQSAEKLHMQIAEKAEIMLKQVPEQSLEKLT